MKKEFDVFEVSYLVIEDEPNVRKLLIDDLKKIGVTGFIYEAVNGKDALKIVKDKYTTAYRVGFIVADITMPKMNGLKFLEEARKLSYTKNVPILMLTSSADKNTVLDAIKKGASNYLLKPWTEEDLVNRIISSWNKHNQKKE